MSNLTGYLDSATINSHSNLMNSISSSSANLSSSTGKRSARNNSSQSSVSYETSMSLWSNDLSSGIQENSIPTSKGKSNKKESHNRIERKRRDYINAQIACLGNLLPPELYRDVSEGKRNKGSVLRLSVNYISDLQNTVAQIGSIQHENQLARQLIPLLTLQKALADLVEAIPHCLDVHLDHSTECGSSISQVSANNSQILEIKSENVEEDAYTGISKRTDIEPNENIGFASSRKRPRRLVSAFQQAKCHLSTGASQSEHLIASVDSSDVVNGMQNNPVYEEEYQSWARLSEYNQKQEQQHQQVFSVNASTPGNNSTSTPCSVSSAGSCPNNNQQQPNSLIPVSAFTNTPNANDNSNLGNDLKLMYTTNLLPHSISGNNCIINNNSLECLMPPSVSSSSAVPSTHQSPSQYLLSANGNSAPPGHPMLIPGHMLASTIGAGQHHSTLHLNSSIDVNPGGLSRSNSGSGHLSQQPLMLASTRNGPLGLILDQDSNSRMNIKSEQFDGGINSTTTDDQEMLSTRVSSLGGYFQDHIMHQHLSSLEQNSTSQLDHDSYSIDPSNGLLATANNGPTLMHVGSLFNARRQLLNPVVSRSLGEVSTFTLLVDSQNLAPLGHYSEDYE